jgi:hypothetical protein
MAGINMDDLEHSKHIDAAGVSLEQRSQHVIDEDSLHLAETGTPLRQGYDDAYDTPPEGPGFGDTIDNIQEILSALNLISQHRQHHPAADDVGNAHVQTSTCDSSGHLTDENPSTEDEDEAELLQVPVPDATTEPTVFAYERALCNRIRYPKLSRGGEYDTRAYTPTFVHDCLMIPGTLAAVMDKVHMQNISSLFYSEPSTNPRAKKSPEDIIRRMTPALLPGFHPHVHTSTHQPCIIQSAEPDDYVQGMVIFGQGREARDRIHKHYRPDGRRVKLQVEVEVLVPDGSADGWSKERKKIWANAWLWSNVGSVDVHFAGMYPRWTIEAYLGGAFSGPPRLRIGYDGFVGEDYDDGESENEEGGVCNHAKQNATTAGLAVQQPKPKREVVRGGFGPLDYERSEAAVGWW